MDQIRERRQSQRIPFEKQQKIMGHFYLPGREDKSVVVQILNMSGGGVFFTLRSSRGIPLKVGDKIFFQDIVNQESKTFSLKLHAEIIWITDDPTMEYTGIGTKFLHMNPEHDLKVQDCIKHCQFTEKNT